LTRRLIALFRATRLALHICYGLTLAIAYPWFSKALQRHILQRWSADLLHIFNVRIDIGSDDPLHKLRCGLIVTNHISWLDVFVLNAVVPMRFVAKSEVRRWPVIGWLCVRAQTLFIERGKARSAARINVQLVEMLQRGGCLAVFPEGTTTDGTSLAHFHSSLLQPAIDAASRIHPIAIRYLDADGTHSTAAAYIDDLSFGASMWNILSEPELHVRLIATPPLNAQDMDRRTLTQTAHQRISFALRESASFNFHIPVTPVQHAESNLLPSTR
jgi:1-acyl-sn-glycerol-3-phosphate acyltransferase